MTAVQVRKDSLCSTATFDTLVDAADLDSSASCEELPESQSTENASLIADKSPSKPLSMEEENKVLRSQVEELHSELAYWKSKANDREAKTPTKGGSSEEEDQPGLWEHTMNGLRQFGFTPQSENDSNMDTDTPGESMELPSISDTGLHHRKSASNSYFAKLNISPFKFYEEDGGGSDSNNTLLADEEGVSLVAKSHSSDRGEDSSVDSKDDDEPSFYESVLDRGAWLVGLLVLQSFSSFIIQHNEKLLQRHTVIVRFLTMLVGAGGNAGNQASVRVIRGLATGKIDDANLKPYLKTEVQAGIVLSALLGVAGCVRAAVFLTPVAETFAITSSLIMIVAISIMLGTALPLLMKFVRIDPAHSSTTIQVLMDIMGVAITVYMSSLILDRTSGSGSLPTDLR